MLEIMLGLIALALIFALLYFFTPNDPNSITSGGLRMLLFFLSLWCILGVSAFAFHYAVDGYYRNVTNTYENITQYEETYACTASAINETSKTCIGGGHVDETISFRNVPVIKSSSSFENDASQGSALAAYFTATLWGIIAIAGITFAGLLYMIFLMLKEMVKPKKKFENGPHGG